MFNRVFRIGLLCLAVSLNTCSGVWAQQKPVTKQKDSTIPLTQALDMVGKRFNTQFAYEHNLLAGKTIPVKALDGKTLPEVLKNILYPNNLLFLYVSENAYSIVARDSRFFDGRNPGNDAHVSPAPANIGTATVIGSHTIRGLVIDEKGSALPFVSIWVKGTRRGVQTGERGDFIVPDVLPTDSLVFTSVGFKPEILGVNNQSNVTLQMYTTNKGTLDEVTVVSTGLQQLPKERATGAFATISGKELAKVPSPNVIQRLEGQIAGVKISISSGDRSFVYSSGNQIAINGGTRTVGKNDYNMAVRGTGTLQGESFPLVVVDGAISDLDMSAFNPDDIENVTFLKDAAAASVWGIRAANGVIVINTKKGKNNQSPAINFSMNASIAGKPDLGYLKMMNSAQEVGYEKELVDRGFINQYNLDGSSYYGAAYYPNAGAVLALKLKSGAISQDAYNKSVDSLSAIDNTGQVLDYLLQPASMQQYNLSVSGGNYNSSYYYSASYSRELPNAKKTIGERLTLTLNNNWKLFKIATLSTSFRGAFFKYTNNGMGVNSLYPSRGASVLLPYMQLADANGKGISYDRLNPDFTNKLSPGAFVNWQYNYLDELNNNDDTQKDNNYSFNANLNVPIYKGLSASVQYSNERTFSNHRVFYNPQTFYYRNMVNNYTDPSATKGNGLGITSGGILSGVNTNVNNYAVRGQLAYDKTIRQLHQLNVIAGSEIRQTQTGQGTSTLYGYNTQTGISIPVSYLSYAYPSIAGYSSSIGGSPNQQDKTRRFLSYFSNAAYTYNGKYSLSGSLRYDDYNNFGLDVKYRATPLWSGGAKWAISKESFMSKVTWVDNLSLRATYGVNGNISTTTYPFTAIGLGGTDLATSQPYAFVSSLANPELKWEKTYVTNIGLDFSLFNNRLGGAIDGYFKNGKDLLYSFPINSAYAGSIGSGYLTRNTATMTGKGFDASLNGVVLNNKNWNWNMGLTFSYNVNKITDGRFDTTTITPTYISYYPQSMGNVSGYSSDKLLVYRNAGLNEQGQTMVYNTKGDKVGVTSPLAFADLKYAGHTTPPYFGGFTNNIRYKQFSMYILMTYQFGGIFLKPSINNYITSYYNLNYSVSGDVDKRWRQKGDEANTNVPGLNGTAAQVTYSLARYQYSDINVLSSDYIRLREISLSYEVPATYMHSLFAKGASLGVAVRNLGLIWKANKDGYDPDFTSYPNGGYSLPAAKSFDFSLKLNF